MCARLTRERGTEIVKERRRQQRALDTREKILDAAFEEFAEFGFEAASTRRIASKLGLQHPLIRYHFQSKEGLWKTVLSTVNASFLEFFRGKLDIGADEDDVEKLMRVQEGFVRFAAAHPNFHWLMSHEARRESDRLTWILEEQVRDYVDAVADLIRSAQRQGRYVRGDPYHLFYLFVGSVTRVFMLSAEVKQVMGRSPFSKKFVEDHVALCRALFFRDSVAAPEPPQPAAKAARKRTPANPAP